MENDRKVVLRVLLYEGPEEWINRTMARNVVQKGVKGVGRFGERFSIQEVTLPGWLSRILSWVASKQPSASLGFKETR